LTQKIQYKNFYFVSKAKHYFLVFFIFSFCNLKILKFENEISNITKFANEILITDLLPIIDDLERSLAAGKEKNNGDSFYKGIELIYSKLMKILEQKGLKPIEALNKPFDVNYHEAMMMMPKDDIEPNIVIQEVEKGYTLHDKVIRHAKVIVSSEKNGE